jgi:hypothetical protein
MIQTCKNKLKSKKKKQWEDGNYYSSYEMKKLEDCETF